MIATAGGKYRWICSNVQCFIKQSTFRKLKQLKKSVSRRSC